MLGRLWGVQRVQVCVRTSDRSPGNLAGSVSHRTNSSSAFNAVAALLAFSSTATAKSEVVVAPGIAYF